MASKALDPAEHERRLKVTRECDEKGLPRRDAAAALGLNYNTYRAWTLTHKIEPQAKVIETQELPPVTPRERHDSAFYRKRATDLRKELDAAHHTIEELGGIRSVGISAPEWASPEASQVDGRAILIAHTSDLHFGECIDEGEISGINRYDHQTARDRMRRYFEAVCEIGPRWLNGDPCDGVLLTMGGDLISGDIHEELMRTNGLTAHEQVKGVVEIYEAGICKLRRKYGRVHVVAVPGNHGRTTHKPTAKLVSRLSYDILAADMLKDRLADFDSTVTWQIATGTDVRTTIYGRTILTTHGDKIGTGGGQGFAGPVLPIIRGGNKVRLQSLSAGLGCDLILMGHYHTSAAPPGILANGSVPGYSEYGNAIRGAVEPPKQWLARFSLKWGLCETLAVRLDTPEAGKPRIRAGATTWPA